MLPTVIMQYATAATSIPIAILRGADGSLPFLAKDVNSNNENGVSATTKNGLNCWNSCGRICMVSSMVVKIVPTPATHNSETTAAAALARFVFDWNNAKRA